MGMDASQDQNQSSNLIPGLTPDLLPLVISALPVAVCCISLQDQRIVYGNPAFQALWGYKAGELGTLGQWIDALPDDRQQQLARGQWASLWQQTDRGDGLPAAGAQVEMGPVEIGPVEIGPMELTVQCKGGAIKTVLNSGALLPRQGYALMTCVDISQQKEDELRFKQAEERARENESVARESELLSRMLLSHSHEMIVIAPSDGLIRFVSPGVQEITGWSQGEYVAQDLLELVHPEDRDAVHEARRRILEGGARQRLRYRIRIKAGGFRWVEGFVAPYQDHGARHAAGYVVTLRDIASQKEQEDSLAMENSQLAQLAQLDELTGIGNRRVFKAALNREARRISRTSQSLALLLLDVDHFKKYNDLYGHLQGDACLRQVAQALKMALHRVADLVARYGGEEFVMLLPMTEPEGAERVAQNVLNSVAALRIPHAGTAAGIVTVSVGIGLWPASHPLDEERLIEEADRALYRAKNQGRNSYCLNQCAPREKTTTAGPLAAER